MFIGSNIKHLRYLFGMTTRQMAERIESSNGTVSRYENGAAEPNLETVARIANAFDIPLEVFAREDFKEKWVSKKEYDKWVETRKLGEVIDAPFIPSGELLLAIANSIQTQAARFLSLRKHYVNNLSHGDKEAANTIMDELAAFEQDYRNQFLNNSPDGFQDLLSLLPKKV